MNSMTLYQRKMFKVHMCFIALKLWPNASLRCLSPERLKWQQRKKYTRKENTNIDVQTQTQYKSGHYEHFTAIESFNLNDINISVCEFCVEKLSEMAP